MPKAPVPPPTSPAAERPPILVWVACGLMLFFALDLALTGVLQLSLIRAVQRRGDQVDARAWLVLVIYVVVTAAYVAASVGLYRRRAWARTVGLVLTGLNLVVGLAVPIAHHEFPSPFALLVQIGFLVILLRREIAAWIRPTAP